MINEYEKIFDLHSNLQISEMHIKITMISSSARKIMKKWVLLLTGDRSGEL